MSLSNALVLLAPALWALPMAPPTPKVESRPALALELRFSCPRPVHWPLEYLQGTRVVVEVPEGCAGAGGKFLMELRCGKKGCKGTLFQDGEPAASLRGSRARLRTREVARWAKGLESLQLRVLGETLVDVSDGRGPPVDVHVVHGGTTVRHRLVPGEAGIVRWRTPRGQVAIALYLQRSGPAQAHLTGVSDKGRTLFDAALPMGGELEVSCVDAALDCEGRVRFMVREAQPTKS